MLANGAHMNRASFTIQHQYHSRILFVCEVVLLLLGLAAQSWAQDSTWRLRILDAAVSQGEMVLLGEIAQPYGPIDAGEWQRLAQRPLWAAPPTEGKPLQIAKNRLSQALRESLGDLADRCLLPQSLAIQRGGAVLYETDIRALVVKELTPLLATMEGQAEMTDFRLPAYIFLGHKGQSLEVEPVKPAAGRLTLRFAVKEMDDSVVRRFTGSSFVDVWVDVPVAAKPYNRGDTLTPDGISHARKNMAYMKGEVWDGRGGPWQLVRAIGTGQPIFATDIEARSAIKKGNIVTMIYKKGNVELRVQAEALSDGAAGDTIPVRNMQTKKQVYATVQNADTVWAK